jgi:hypothetical protein
VITSQSVRVRRGAGAAIAVSFGRGEAATEDLSAGRVAYVRGDGLGAGVDGLGAGVEVGVGLGDGDELGEGAGDPPTVSVTVALVTAGRPLAAGTRSRKENVPAAVPVHRKVQVPLAPRAAWAAVVHVPLVCVCRVTVVPARLCGCTVAVKVTDSPTAGAVGAARRSADAPIATVTCGD